MKIWVDADACPGAIKEILYKAAKRTGLQMTLVANRLLRTPPLANVCAMRVPSGLDAADNEIVKRVAAGDLVITADIPLAAEVVAKGATGINPRGELYNADNIKARLSMRDFMDELRAGGVETGGPSPLSRGDRQNFGNQLDRLLAAQAKKNR